MPRKRQLADEIDVFELAIRMDVEESLQYLKVRLIDGMLHFVLCILITHALTHSLYSSKKRLEYNSNPHLELWTCYSLFQLVLFHF